MRVEPVPYLFRSEDRRRRFADRRVEPTEHRSEAPKDQRARHTAHVWYAPAFVAHLLGQTALGTVLPRIAQRAYTQPEARTPLRPSHVRSA
jgi:hypothetical protein